MRRDTKKIRAALPIFLRVSRKTMVSRPIPATVEIREPPRGGRDARTSRPSGADGPVLRERECPDGFFPCELEQGEESFPPVIVDVCPGHRPSRRSRGAITGERSMRRAGETRGYEARSSTDRREDHRSRGPVQRCPCTRCRVLTHEPGFSGRFSTSAQSYPGIQRYGKVDRGEVVGNTSPPVSGG